MEKTVRAYDGDTVEIRIRDPRPVSKIPAFVRRAFRPRIDEDEVGEGRAIIKVFDLGTFSAKSTKDGVRYDGYFEIPLEGPAVLTQDDASRNRRRLLEEYRFRVTLESGEEIPSCYPLQVDEETANANVSLELRGKRGSILRGLSIGSDKWLAPESVEDQRETIERLKRDVVVNVASDGLDKWTDALDRIEKRSWSSNIRGRVDRDGEFLARTAPQQADLIFRSIWQYESWSLRDQHRYMVTKGDTIRAKAIDPPPALRLSGGQSTRVDVYAAPQIHDVRFEWLDLYLINVGWWIVIIPIPMVRIMTLRSAQFPHVFTASGTPEQDVTVGVTMSDRIARTQTFARAVEARIFSPFYRHIASIQGRYGVYQRNQTAGTLCAVLDYRWPGKDVEPDSLKVFRRVTIEREHTLLEVGGLYVPGIVYPWVENFSIPPFYEDESGQIDDGF